MNVSTVMWRNEMNNMLAVFDRQATISLNNIRMAFQQNGLSLDAEFKQYFLNTSFDRIKLTYYQFEITSMMGKPGNQTNSQRVLNSNIKMENTTEKMDYIEIDDSSDEKTKTPPMSLKIVSVHSLFNIATQRPTANTTAIGERLQQTNKNYGEIRIGSTIIRNNTIKPKKGVFDGGHCNLNVAKKIKPGVPTICKSQYGQSRGKNLKVEALVKNTAVNDCTSIVTSTTTSTIKPTVTSSNRASRTLTKTENEPRSTQKLPQNPKSSNKLQTKKQFKCDFCNYSSNFRNILNRHMRTHNDKNRCDICYKSFAHPINLKNHEATHINEIPYHCRGCFGRFVQKAEKDDHEKVCTNRRYECHICKKFVTVFKSILKRHMTNHSGEKPFRCEICMKRFNVKANLKTHLDTIHHP